MFITNRLMRPRQNPVALIPRWPALLHFPAAAIIGHVKKRLFFRVFPLKSVSLRDATEAVRSALVSLPHLTQPVQPKITCWDQNADAQLCGFCYCHKLAACFVLFKKWLQSQRRLCPSQQTAALMKTFKLKQHFGFFHQPISCNIAAFLFISFF